MPTINPFKRLTRFHFLLALGVLWIAVLAAMMIIQNTPPEVEPNATLDTYSRIQKTPHFAEQHISPLPEPIGLNPDKVALGFKLFFESMLSHDNSVSCSTCHNLEKGGADNVPFSAGINNSMGTRNTPTIFNSSFNFRQFWDGRAFTLEDQVDAPIHNPKEMGSNWGEIQQKLGNFVEYRKQFEKVYGSKTINAQRIRDAIATFERALVTTNSPFDRFLKGDKNALSSRQKEGYRLFKSYGCINCHQGVNVGGNMFARLGTFQDYYSIHPENGEDLGRFDYVGTKESEHEFKVPSLRNVALTAPYFHDGSINTLNESITLMAQYQLGVKLLNQEATAIEDFLNSLTGETPMVLK